MLADHLLVEWRKMILDHTARGRVWSDTLQICGGD
ncbi:hypothetical protein CD178_03359 (plasmid) [Komagataeibacter saccharivorans]|uniref:Uncharacterized protein n=1 Tax=Komagataeibacter saccharivorans TaxID=265959 RepID=A0A347WGW0_9PROT|nr:hypothetical protein CD178_03359 [Komagataeibacter saccharivorans]